MTPPTYDLLFSTFAFILGAAIGSFLNVCIYRMPRDLSVNEPKRSFCPSCKYQIPWHHNLPLFSWLILRGRCGNCGGKISVRYFGVELLTGLLFLAVWHHVWPQEWALALPYWILVSLFVVATFIDLEFFIIPDEITWGGTIAGILLSLALPGMMGCESSLEAGLWSLIGAATGYFLLWGVVELGKKAFGKKQFKLAGPTAFTWARRAVQTERREESDADLIVGDLSWKELPPPSVTERLRRFWSALIRIFRADRPAQPQRGEAWVWSDVFSRDSDRLIMKCPQVSVDDDAFSDATLTFGHSQLEIGQKSWPLDKVNEIKGVVNALIVPREAMGFGDVKFIAAIGAFLGWKAVLFTVFGASTIGAIIGLGTIAIGRREWSAKIPFGPYLAFAALAWLFAGPQIIAWYLQRFAA